MDTEKKRLILVADDEPVNKKLFAILLDKLGYGFIFAEDGEEAVQMAKDNEPELIFMDIRMPKMNGYDAAKKLRELGFEIPIIAVTAENVHDNHEKCQNAGINDLVIKPFKLSEIEMMLNKWLNKALTSDSTEKQSIFFQTINSVFDAEEMLNTFMDNEEVAIPLLSRFIERSINQLENIKTFVKTGDWESIRRDAHMIRGASLTMGGLELGQAAAILEEAAKEVRKDEINSAYIAVCKALEDFKKEVDEFISARS